MVWISKRLCQWAVEQIETNMYDYDETDLKEEISDMMGEDVWEDMRKKCNRVML